MINGMKAEVSANPLKLAIIDDCKTIRLVTSKNMESFGWQVKSFQSDFGVVIKLKDFNPDIILVDVEMPRLNGKGLARALRKSYCLPDTPTYFYSSLDPQELEKQVHLSGLDGFFSKKTSYQQLNTALRWRLTFA
ncbi:MAG: response regulator [Planctomycetota bacterium]|nr:response regulator [Planctomycetota bacterium]